MLGHTIGFHNLSEIKPNRSGKRPQRYIFGTSKRRGAGGSWPKIDGGSERKTGEKWNNFHFSRAGPQMPAGGFMEILEDIVRPQLFSPKKVRIEYVKCSPSSILHILSLIYCNFINDGYLYIVGSFGFPDSFDSFTWKILLGVRLANK